MIGRPVSYRTEDAGCDGTEGARWDGTEGTDGDRMKGADWEDAPANDDFDRTVRSAEGGEAVNSVRCAETVGAGPAGTQD